MKCMAINPIPQKGLPDPVLMLYGTRFQTESSDRARFHLELVLCYVIHFLTLILWSFLNVALGRCSCKIDCSGKFHMTFVTLNIVPCELSKDCPSDWVLSDWAAEGVECLTTQMPINWLLCTPPCLRLRCLLVQGQAKIKWSLPSQACWA